MRAAFNKTSNPGATGGVADDESDEAAFSAGAREELESMKGME
jgi:hypothetical protein